MLPSAKGLIREGYPCWTRELRRIRLWRTIHPSMSFPCSMLSKVAYLSGRFCLFVVGVRRYVEARMPTYALDYTFSPIEGEGEAMLLIPPFDAPDTRPVYYIKVTHDLFDPSFFVTTVRRGGRSDGAVVGDFMSVHFLINLSRARACRCR